MLVRRVRCKESRIVGRSQRLVGRRGPASCIASCNLGRTSAIAGTSCARRGVVDRRVDTGIAGEFYPSARSYLRPDEGARILLVESDADRRFLFASGLRRSGYKVLAAPDAFELRSIVREIAGRTLPAPEAVVLDIHLSGGDALEHVALLRAACGPVPVVLTSAYSYSEVRELAPLRQVADYLRKPISSARLSRVVCSAVEEALSARAP